MFFREFDWTNPVAIWWMGLACASIFNICAWFWIRLYKYRNIWVKTVLHFRSNTSAMVWLSFFYVFVCAFRSLLPRADVQRIVLFDTWFSSVFVGRTVATIAEMAFIAQWSIVLMLLGEATKNKWTCFVSKLILVTISIAEICSWYAVIRTHYLGNVIEESLWGISYALIASALMIQIQKLTGVMKLSAVFAAIGSFLYVTFMFTVDVPMYFLRLVQDNANGKPYLSFVDGLIDLNTRWHVTYSIHDWKQEIPWMTLYFSFAVLVSLSLCLLPMSAEGWKKHLKN